jgi:ATP-dependent helicase Lhr and Lhr-like helicase
VSAAFDRLSPAMQYQIVNGLGFRSLRPVQEAAIGPVLDGRHCVVLAPTAGGKTEAAFFPLLSAMDAEDWAPVSVVYVSPIRALLNDQRPRLERYAGLIGRRVAVRHGDVPQAERRAFVREPADVLLTTPESLEVMLLSPSVPARRLFRTLRAIVIDEIHAFAGDDRGGHLAAVLARLTRIAGRDVQRIGLSATVGNPEEILAWMAGPSRRPGVVVAPGGGAERAAELALDYVGSLDNAAKVIAALHRGEKRLVFVDNRRKVEALGRALRGLGADAFVLHSSLSAEERRRTERAFVESTNCVIVATSSLELGIDIGDLDRVVQLDAPSTVASLMQRMGRTGRRAGTRSNCLFLATDPWAAVQAAALIRLYRSGWVEPVSPVRRAAHLLAHQLIALSLQEHGVAESDWWGWVADATPFAGLDATDRSALLGHMVAEDILFREGGRLGLGRRGEALYGRRNFMELYAVFDTPKILSVRWGTREIGTLEAAFAALQDVEDFTFTLGAKAWRATALEWSRGFVHVEPAERARTPRWRGSPVLLGRKLCEAMRGVLADEAVAVEWTARARECLAGMREEYAWLPGDGAALVADGDGFALWTFAGGRANNLLAKVLEQRLGGAVRPSNLAVGLVGRAGKSRVAIAEALDALREAERPSEDDALRLASSCARTRLSKFQPCLTERLEAAYLASVLTDASGARDALATWRTGA